MTENAIARRTIGDEELALTSERLDLLRQTLAAELTEPEFQLYLEYVRRAALDPFRRQIYPLKVQGKVSIHVGIDGLRLLAQRSGKYRGQAGPYWCGPDRPPRWEEVWLDETQPPAAARVGVYHEDMARPIWGVARYVEYVQMVTDQRTRERRPRQMWAQFPSVMLAKCAEAIAIRKAFPSETSGLYASIDDEGTVSTKPQVVNPEAPATQYQKGELMRLSRELEWGDEERRRRAGVASFADLTKGQADRLIDDWTALHDEAIVVEGEILEDSEGGRDVVAAPGQTPSEMSGAEGDALEVEDGPGSTDPGPPPAIDRKAVEARLIEHYGSRPRMLKAGLERFHPTGSWGVDDVSDADLAAWLSAVVG